MIGLPPQGRGERLFAKELRQRLRVEPNGEDSFSLPQDFSRWHPFARLQYLEMNVRLADYIVRYLDTMSMAYSLEVRVPFLDHEFVELCAQIPPQVKMHRLEEKHVLRRAMVEILPPEIVTKKTRTYRSISFLAAAVAGICERTVVGTKSPRQRVFRFAARVSHAPTNIRPAMPIMAGY